VELDDFLVGLKKEGRLHSSSAFSLDHLAAAGKLRQFRLNPPESYLLKFVQAAVAVGSPYLDIASSGNRLRVEWEGRTLSLDQMQTLPLPEYSSRGQRHLCTGLQASLACELEWLCLECWDEHSLERWTCTGREQILSGATAPRAPSTGTRVSLQKTHPGAEREAELVKQLARFSPIPIKLRGHLLPPGRFGHPILPKLGQLYKELLRLNDDYIFGQCHRHHHLLQIRWPEPDGERAALAIARDSPASVIGIAEDAHPGHPGVEERLRCQSVLAIEMDLKHSAHFSLIQDGVEVGSVVRPSATWGNVGLLSANHLNTDLSSLRLLQDDAFEATLLQAEQHAQILEQQMARLVQAGEHENMPLPRLLRSRFLPTWKNS
jgi:hypothetical protein